MKEGMSSVILLFHSVEERDLPSLRGLGNIRPAVFEKLCRTLKREFDVVSLETLTEAASGGSGLSRGGYLAVTFDDGGKSYASYAAPAACSLGVPTTCFLVTGCIGGGALYWRYLYNYCINSGHGSELAGIISAEYGTALRPEEVISFTRRNYDREKTGTVMEGILKRLVTAEEYREKEGELFLSLDDIDRLRADSLVGFGVHTQSHPVMKALDYEDIRQEISGSISFYREKIEDSVPLFSVPFGRLGRDYDERTVLAALELGIPAVFSAYGGRNEEGRPPYNLRRIPVTGARLEGGVGAFVRSLREGDVAPEYLAEEESLRDAVQRWRKRGVSPRKT
jgi:peptidoglycan/xylan/chitin deacetylase (PgdA/CDA1 family)